MNLKLTAQDIDQTIPITTNANFTDANSMDADSMDENPTDASQDGNPETEDMEFSPDDLEETNDEEDAPEQETLLDALTRLLLPAMSALLHQRY